MNLLECKIKENTFLIDSDVQVFHFVHPVYYINPDEFVDTHTLAFKIFKN